MTFRFRPARGLLFILALWSFAIPAAAQLTLIPTGSTWSYRKGTNEVSNPVTLWRATNFNAAAWPVATAPFHYGTNAIGGDDNVLTGTVLSDMSGRYRCIFLRRAFVVTNVAEVQSVSLVATYDDGFVAWINGVEVARAAITNVQPAYTNNANATHEASPPVTFNVTNSPQSYLAVGTNVLAVQAFNQSLSGSSDFRFDTLLQVIKVDTVPPVVVSISPPTNATVSALSQITVVFSEPVAGLDAGDLLLNDQPAASVSTSGATNIFFFTQPPPGPVSVAWNEPHEISDAAGNPFNAGSAATWNYTLADSVAPLVALRTPVAGAQVSRLTQVEVTFSEPVLGVNAADLLIQGQPAASVTGSDAGPYVFQFAQPASGTVQFAWAAGHGITDTAPAPNAFAGGNWNVTLSPGAAAGDVIINEFAAGNVSGLPDENGEPHDWIELYNRGTNAVNLLGWSLTDDRDVPAKWTFPSRALAPGQFLVVFASEKDRRAPAGANPFHTNFKLNPFGEYLALFNAESPRLAVSEFAPAFPEQRNNYSFGLDATNAWRYFQTPTPGAANGASAVAGLAPLPHFSVERGLFDAPFNLLLTATLPGATIRYTTDGTEPTAATGTVYTGPLAITNTTTLRAATFATGYLPSRTRTHSYIFLDAVIAQPNNPPGFPDNWGTNYGTSTFPPASIVPGFIPADYEMDLDPVRVDPNDPASPIDPDKLQRLKDGLRELPVVSLVLKTDDMFGPGGLYPNSREGGAKPNNEKPCSVEMILPGGTTAFAIAGGIDLHGNASREPRKNPKHGFKLSFKGDYGESSLAYQLFPDSPARDFDDLILRADFGTSWRHWSDASTEGLGAFQRTRATRTRDAWYKHTMRDLGWLASHSRFFHLFINGLYWGTYDFTEQPNASFAPNYLGGAKDDFDIYEQGTLRSGTAAAYAAMTGLSNLVLNANYELMKQRLDVPEFIDYTLLHFFIGHQDWGYDPNKNWVAIRKRVGPDATFKYLPWDGENLLLDTNINQVTAARPPSDLHTKLDDNAQYRLDFADRVFKHMIAPDGALTCAANVARWQYWQAVMDKPIVAESARWGDYRRDVHRYSNGSFELYTRENQWLAENDRLVNGYFVGRNATVLAQLRAAGLYPDVEAPSFSQPGGRIPAGFNLTLTGPDGTIYFTTNGADPRVYYAGTVAPSAAACSGPLTLNCTVEVKARTLSGTNWSALNEATFTVGQLGVPLCFTEIMFNPVGGDAYEFVEVRNTGATPLDVGGFSFQGIGYRFADGTVMEPGETVLLSSSADTNAFHTRYPSAIVFGRFNGSLDNGGERLAILDRNGQTVIAVHYDDQAGWPKTADGGGYSLEIIDPRGDPNAPDNWRASTAANGTPGLPPVAPVLGNIVLNELMADNVSAVTNGGACPDWLELFNRGSTPVNLAGWSLTDDSNPRKFVFPATNLAAGAFLVVWCDNATNAPGLHTGFALGRKGDSVLLHDAGTNRADAITFGLQLPNYSIGRVSGAWQLTLPTPNANNIAATLAASTNVSLNEWLANPDPGDDDWIELFNRSSNAPVALRGLYLGTSNALFQIRSLSFLPPRGYVQLIAEEDAGADLEFKLPAGGGAIALYDPTGLPLEQVGYGAQTTGVSQGRLPDGTAAIATFDGSVSPAASNYLLSYSGPALNEVLARNQRAAVSPWGDSPDFTELYNPGAGAANVGGMSLGRSVDDAHPWTIPAGTTIASGQYLVVWCDDGRAASTNGAAALNTGFALDGASGDVYLFNTAGQAVDWVNYGFQLPDQSIGRSGGNWRLLSSPSPGAANSTAATLGAVTALRVNEWMADALAGNNWFEIYNPGALPVDLGGLFVTDDPSVIGVTKSPVAPLSFIGGGKWVKFEADGSVSQGRNHANFSLDHQGETLRLYDTNLALIDAVDFGLQTAGVSQGRLPDGATNIVDFPATPTPEESNYLPLPNVVISEVLSHTDPPLEDAIELYNPSGAAVNIGGWFLSDNQGDLKRYRIPDGTVIPPGGFKVFYQYQFGPADGETDLPPLFTFNSAHGDEAYVSEADDGANLTGYRAGVAFGAAANGVSFGRFQTSVGVDFVALSQRTFGADSPVNVSQFRTGAGRSNATPLVGPVVINELMYHPPGGADESENPDLEFIELFNPTAAAVPLFDPAHPTNVWRLANAVTFSFPTNLSIPAGGFLLVVPFNPATDAAALAAFRAAYGTNGILVGPWSGKLDNAGESVELYRPDTPQGPAHPDAGFVPLILVDRVVYSDAPPWPTNADGGGASLRRIQAPAYGNDPENWTASAPSAAQPNDGADTDGDGLPDAWELAHGTNPFVPDADADPDHDGMSNLQEFLAGTDPQSALSLLKLSAAINSPGSVTLQFMAISNHTYSVLYRNALSAGPWAVLASAESRSTNRTETIVDALGVSTNRFYRLVTPQRQPNADADADGLPDAWETAHGTNPLAPDADVDPDHDGMSNLQEFLAGTDPQSALSLLKLSAAINSPGAVTLQFTAISNHTYSVLYRPSLLAGPWVVLANAASRSTNRTETIVDAIGVSTNRFYQLVTPQWP